MLVNKENFLFLLCVILCSLMCNDTSDETNETSLTSDTEHEVSAEDEEETTTMDPMKQDWVAEAVLDVGYYLRNNKFNDFDRRYSNVFNND